METNEAAQLVQEQAHEDANIIFGAVIDDALGDEVRVTVIAAGFDGGARKHVTDPAGRHRAEGEDRQSAGPALGESRRPEPEPRPEYRPEPRPSRSGTDDDDIDLPPFMMN